MSKKRSRARCVLTILTSVGLSAVFSTSLDAQIYGEGDRLPGMIEEEAMISLNVRERPLSDVAAHIQDRVGINIILVPGVEGSVTIELDDIPWRDALELVAEQAGCVVIEKSSRLFKIERPPRVTFSFVDEEIKTVIHSIGMAANASISVAPEVVGEVNLHLNNVPWRDALDTVVKTLGFLVVEDSRGILRIISPEKLEEQLEIREFELRYLRPRSNYVARIKTQYAHGTGAEPTDDIKKEFRLLSALEQLLTTNGKLDFFDRENVIFVKDTKPVIDKIAEVLGRLDVEPVQIYIDVKFVTTTNTDTSDLAFGFDSGFTTTLSGATRTSRLPFNLGSGSFADNLLPGSSTDNIGADGTSPTASPVTPGFLDFSATSLAVRLLQTDTKSEIIQAPKIVTLNHQEATIFVGEAIRYAEAEAKSNQSGGLELVIREADDSPVQTGFQLYVKPHVVPGTNRIMMSVIPEAETLTGTTDPDRPGFDLFQVGAGTVAGLGQISLPRVGSQTIVTNMMLESGQTGVIGGLVTDNVRESVTKVPFLGDLPVVGWLFKREEKRTDKQGLLVFVTPYVVRSSTFAEEELGQKIRSMERRAGAEWDSFSLDAFE